MDVGPVIVVVEGCVPGSTVVSTGTGVQDAASTATDTIMAVASGVRNWLITPPRRSDGWLRSKLLSSWRSSYGLFGGGPSVVSVMGP